MTNFRLLSLVSLFLLAVFQTVSAVGQDTDIRTKLISARDSSSKVYVIVKNGNEFKGTIEAVGDSTFTMITEAGEFKLFIRQVKEFRLISDSDPNSYWFENISRTRLFVTPTARMNKGFSGYYQNIYVLYSNISISPFDFLTLNLGFLNIPEITFDGDFYSLGIKTGFNVSETFYVAANATRFVIDAESTTLIYPSVTVSHNGNDLTSGLGVNRFDGVSEGVFFLLGGQLRVGERISVVSENFFFSGEGNLFLIGPRFLGKRIAADVAMIIEPEFGMVLPYVSFMVTF